MSFANTDKTGTGTNYWNVCDADGKLIVVDGGNAIPSSFGVSGEVFTSADQSASAAAITDAPASGKKLVITDIIISSDTQLTLTLSEETSGYVIAKIYVAANSTVNVSVKGRLKLSTADTKLLIQASASGNIAVTAIYYSES